MNRIHLKLVLGGIAVVLGLYAIWSAAQADAPVENDEYIGGQSITYRGVRIRLAQEYADFDAYKNDTANIHPSQIARVQMLVRGAPVTRGCYLWKGVVDSVGVAAFPGYGTTSMVSDWMKVRALALEVPQSGESRVFIMRPKDGQWCIVDDFFVEGTPLILSERKGKWTIANGLRETLAERIVASAS
jgi:hypothetical protein